MPISPKQTFECVHCGDTVTSNSLDNCDQLEGSKCTNCDYGHYQWIGPWHYEGRPEQIRQAEWAPMDDIEETIDEAFEKIMME
jgi:hypothetical protein